MSSEIKGIEDFIERLKADKRRYTRRREVNLFIYRKLCFEIKHWESKLNKLKGG
mgnify:CR=1 FL=1